MTLTAAGATGATAGAAAATALRGRVIINNNDDSDNGLNQRNKRDDDVDGQFNSRLSVYL